MVGVCGVWSDVSGMVCWCVCVVGCEVEWRCGVEVCGVEVCGVEVWCGGEW